MKQNKLRKFFIGWCLISLATGALVVILASKAFAHEIEHTHPDKSAFPRPPVSDAISKCLSKHKEVVTDRRFLSDRVGAYNLILIPCIKNADRERQYQDAIKMFMAQKGVKL